jgi:hypothetical protein
MQINLFAAILKLRIRFGRRINLSNSPIRHFSMRQVVLCNGCNNQVPTPESLDGKPNPQFLRCETCGNEFFWNGGLTDNSEPLILFSVDDSAESSSQIISQTVPMLATLSIRTRKNGPPSLTLNEPQKPLSQSSPSQSNPSQSNPSHLSRQSHWSRLSNWSHSNWSHWSRRCKLS